MGGSELGEMLVPVGVWTESESVGFKRRLSDVVGEAAGVYGFQTPVRLECLVFFGQWVK